MLRLRKFYPKLTQVLLAVLTVGIWILAIEHYPSFANAAHATAPNASVSSLGTVDLHRINVKDTNGTTRFVISDAQNYPPAKVRGKTYPRSIHNAAGILLYNPNGSEAGGLETSKAHGRRHAALILDYGYQPTDGISMGVTESADGKHWASGLSISDRRPYAPGPVKSTRGATRISLGDKDGTAGLVIKDPKGRTRIFIGVGNDGKPRIEMLNATGAVVYSAKLASGKGANS